MANNRNESDRHYFDERDYNSRAERGGYDNYPPSYRDRSLNEFSEREEKNGHRAPQRERVSRRKMNEQSDAEHPSYGGGGGFEPERSFNDSNYFSPTFREGLMQEWMAQTPHAYQNAKTNEYNLGLGRSSRFFERENYVGRGPKGYRRSDERIKEDVCDALERHSAIDASEIEVSINEGVVILQGFVENRAQKRLSEDVIENLTGVKDIRNELSIDQRLFERLREQIRNNRPHDEDQRESKDSSRTKPQPARH